jgi:hypothetical protein
MLEKPVYGVRPLRFRLTVLWVGGVSLAFFGSQLLLLPLILTDVRGWYAIIFWTVAGGAAGVAGGIAAGVVQRLALSRSTPWRLHWVGFTAFGWAVFGGLVGLLEMASFALRVGIYNHRSTNDIAVFLNLLDLADSIAIPVVAGTAVAVAQWFYLRRYVSGAWVWIAGTALGWAVGVLVSHLLSLLHMPFTEFGEWLVFCICVGVVSAVTMAFLEARAARVPRLSDPRD